MEQRAALLVGGYAIMLGGTNGGHLTSFSLVDILSHGRACAMMNPYYTVFFALAIEDPLRTVGKTYQDAGLTRADVESLSGRELGVAVAEAMRMALFHLGPLAQSRDQQSQCVLVQRTVKPASEEGRVWVFTILSFGKVAPQRTSGRFSQEDDTSLPKLGAPASAMFDVHSAGFWVNVAKLSA